MDKAVKYVGILEWPGYRVGDDGSVWSKCYIGNNQFNRDNRKFGKWRLKSTFLRNGYPCVGFGHSGREYVHRLVCAAFHGPCPPGKECRHLDGNKRNCASGNLAWGTPAENGADRIVHGTAKGWQHYSILRPSAKLTPLQVGEIRA